MAEIHGLRLCGRSDNKPSNINVDLRKYKSIIGDDVLRADFSVFISRKKGGIGVRSFTREYIGALLRDIEVYITNLDSLPAHALINSLEEATKKQLWHLNQDSKIPVDTEAASNIAQISISGKKTLSSLNGWEHQSCCCS
jgi:hypothetical protein